MPKLPVPPEFLPGTPLPEALARQHLRSCGKGVRIYKGSRLVPPHHISIGDFSQIDEGVCIFAGEGVQIGRHVHFALGSAITGGGACIVHDFVGIGAGTRIITGTELLEGGLTNPTVPPHLRAVSRGRVELRAHALIFTNVVILPGITIGEGAVVSAGSIVHHDLKPWAIYGGTPLVQVGVRSPESVLEKERQLLTCDR
jgi:acetyltransferase-like isoleucine patch superfamily enzyme